MEVLINIYIYTLWIDKEREWDWFSNIITFGVSMLSKFYPFLIL